MDEKLPCKVELSLVIFGNDKKSGSILVYAMHQHTHSFILSIRTLRNSEMVGKSIDQGTGKMSVAGMDDHPSLLV